MHQGDETSSATAAGSSPAVGSALHVLAVEDDELVRRQVERSLRQLGHIVRVAAGGLEALQMLATDPRCDVLLTDVVMPGMGGGELAQTVRVLIPELPIVFVSGFHADPLVQQMRSDVRVLVLAKPYRRQQLAQALRRVTHTM